jgi:alpha-amylase/alpha-mannosidase (GH57 family)
VTPLYVSFLWHMHQPNYRDPIRGVYSMPWVRLHAAKAYLDMVVLARKYPEMELTFNLVPSLLEQLEDYAAGAEDHDLILARKPPAELTADEKRVVLSRFFQANTGTMIKPLPRFLELLQSRGMLGTRTEIESAIQKFAAQDYLDLQLLFNLSWLGFSAREDADIRRLIRKGRFFTIEERDLVLEKQREIIARLIPLYRESWREGIIDVTASPFYHPILPLLCDTSAAREGMPNCPLPLRPYSHPKDAAHQVSMSIEYFREKLGSEPKGMWPSEGSVSPAALDIVREAGIRWVATDEEILARSVKTFDRARDLYVPWGAHGVAVFFRDRHLSDQIGFVYAQNPATVAVDDFIAKLRQIGGSSARTPKCAVVVLDGENAWETYPNSGKEFLETLYTRLLAEPGIRPVSFSRYLEKFPPGKTIKSIFPGSWIHGNFDTWIGHQEENDGWDALNNARDALVAKEEALSPDARAEAWREIYKAEGSDWFWWYGEDHSSPNDTEFDRLFRAHLERVYHLLGIPAPAEITEPIIKTRSVRADVEPTGLITPVIDGRATTFYEWISAGWIPAAGPEGVMSCGESVISGIYYGFDLQSCYFRFDPAKREEPINFSRWELHIDIETDDKYRVEVNLAKPDSYTVSRRIRERWVRRTRKTLVAMKRIIELGLPFEDIGVRKGSRVGFVVMFIENGIERERLPQTGHVTFTVPDESFQPSMWQV